MKKLRNLFLVFAFVMAAAVFMPAKAQAQTVDVPTYSVGSDYQTVTVKWKAPTWSEYEMNNGYTVQSYSIKDSTNNLVVASNLDATKTSFSFKKAKGYVARLQISYTYTTSFGGPYTGYYTSVTVNNKPSTYSSTQFAISTFYGNKMSFQVAKYNSGVTYGDTSTQLELYKGSTRVKVLNINYTYSDSVAVSDNAVYRFRVRGIITTTNGSTVKTYKGAWSSFKYFMSPGSQYARNYPNRGVKVVLKKVSSVPKYVISVSTNSTTGFKKTATVTLGSASKKTVNITKYGTTAMKKGTTYYVHVIPYIKTSSGLKKSLVYGSFSFYNPK